MIRTGVDRQGVRVWLTVSSTASYFTPNEARALASELIARAAETETRSREPAEFTRLDPVPRRPKLKRKKATK